MQVDPVQRLFYDQKFRDAFLTKRGDEFQSWFEALAHRAYGADFEAVRSYGRQGDRKCDGRRISTGTIFQVYAPDTFTVATAEAKIQADFRGAVAYWTTMREWVLVTNQERGLPPSTSTLLDQLRVDNPNISIRHWSTTELQRLTREFSLLDWRAIFGDVPGQEEWDAIAIPDIKGVLDELERIEPEPGQEPLGPPSADKLARNALSREAVELLRLGRRKEPLVERYLHRTPKADSGERIAEAFRRLYADLREEGRSPDEILGTLQQYAGAKRGGPRRQAAGLAVLSYYFERCDIFEDGADDA